MGQTGYLLLCLGVGVATAVVRVVYSFLPGVNLTDIVVFALLGTAVAGRRPQRWWPGVAAVVAPTLLLLVVMLAGLGIDKLRDGVGAGHLRAVVLIPLAAFVAGRLAAQRRGL